MKRAAPRGRRSALSPAALMREAEGARRSAHAPYSKFRVGAALLLRDGRVIRGCNVENASYGLSMCAERAAIFNAVSQGERDFVALAVTGGAGSPAPPCGACRQVLSEFAPRLAVYFRGPRGRVLARRLDQLLPHAFDLGARRRR